MKNFLYILLLLWPVNAYASNFYIKINIATNKITSLNQYANMSPGINAGLGYYINDYYRIDVTGGNSRFNFEDKYIPHEAITDTSMVSGTKCIHYKAETKYVMLNNYINVLRRDTFQIYVSGGIGLGKIKEKTTHFFSGILINGEVISIPLSTNHYTSKSTRTFIYSIGSGISTKINSDVSIDLEYSYKDFGKPKYNTSVLQGKKYKAHNFSIGIRLDL